MGRNVPQPIPFPVVASLVALLFGVIACAVALVIEEEQHEFETSLIREVAIMIMDGRKRLGDTDEGAMPNRHNVEWDRGRARQSIMDDYLGEMPKFTEDGFKRKYN
jgi:hypothetical protein